MLCSRAEDWIPERRDESKRETTISSSFSLKTRARERKLTVNNNTPHPKLANNLVKRSLSNEELLASVGESVKGRSRDHEDVSLPHDGGFPVLSGEGIGSDEESETTDADEDTWKEGTIT